MCHCQRTLQFNKFKRRLSTKKTIDIQENNNDYIGPPDPISNLRPMIFHTPQNETELEKKYRKTRQATQIWNQQFWIKHNTSFIQERKQFREELLSHGKQNVTADEMSIFYKEFLDKNWKTHVKYNMMWYKKNIYLLLMEFRVKLTRFKLK